MADELITGNIWVKCGINRTQIPMGGRRVSEYRARLADVLTIAPTALARLDGRPVAEDYVITEGSVLEFVKPQGEKANSPDNTDARAYTAWMVGELRDELKAEVARSQAQTAGQVKQVSNDVAALKSSLNQMSSDVGTIARAVKDSGNGFPPATRPAVHGRQGEWVGYDKSDSDNKEPKKEGYTVGINLSPRRLFRNTLLMGLLGILTWGGARVYHDWRFDSNFTQYMAAAKEAREKGDNPRAVKYEERGMLWVSAQNMTKGRTDVLLDAGPNADVQEWYDDVKRAVDKAQEDYKKKDKNTTPVSYELPTPPSGLFTSLSLYPYNQHFALWLTGSVAMALVGATGVFCTRKKKAVV